MLSTTMSSRVWASIAVLTLAGLIRLPHYDLSWFGNDQINFVAEGRRILSGDWNVIGPLAYGMDLVGPLYSYFVAVLLWIRDDATFVALITATFEVIAAWLVYDAARRLSGQAAGVAAGVAYASAPMLMITTRLIWNPSLLPAAVALGCWLVVRYCERPSTVRLLAVALVSGLALTTHATGIFPSAAFVFIVLVAQRPSLRQLAAAVVVGALPLTPLLWRLVSGTSPSTTGGPPLAANDVLATIAGIRMITLEFPLGAAREHWSALPSTIVLHVEALIGMIGLAIGILRSGPYRQVWLGLALALGTHVIGAVLYAGPVAFYHFSGAVPIACLCVGQGIAVVPRARLPLTALLVVMSMLPVAFINALDWAAIEAGFYRVSGVGLVFRFPPSGYSYGITLRELKRTDTALRSVFPDAVTAMGASHGVRAELWRETGTEFMPRDAEPRADWSSEFVLMGAGATVVHPGARLIGDRVCVFDRPTQVTWRGRPADVPPGWELSAFADDRWYELPLPRRMLGPLSLGPSVPTPWRVPLQYLRGRIHVERPEDPHLWVVSVHSYGNSAHWIAKFAVNGADVPGLKSRVLPTSVYRNEEWLFDLTGRLRQGENVIALAVDGQTPVFDLDVFELPCVDREWYNAGQ